MYSVQVVDPIRAEFLVSTLATHSSTPTPVRTTVIFSSKQYESLYYLLLV